MLLSSKCRVVSWCKGLRASEGNTLILLFVRDRDCSCSATSEQHGKKENNRFENKEQYEDRKCSATSEQNEYERKHDCCKNKEKHEVTGSCFATGEQHENQKNLKTRKSQIQSQRIARGPGSTNEQRTEVKMFQKTVLQQGMARRTTTFFAGKCVLATPLQFAMSPIWQCLRGVWILLERVVQHYCTLQRQCTEN